MAADDAPTGTELAMLRGEVMTALARIEGEIRLVRQAQEDAARRTDDLQADVRRLDDRVDDLDRTRVTRAELDQREERAGQASTRRLTVIGLIITAVNIVIASGIAILSIVLR